MNKNNKDFLGTECIWKLVLKIAIPSMIAQFVNVLYSIVDRIYIGNIIGIGQKCLASIGVCAPILTLISSFAFLIGIGGSPLFSIKLGEKNNQEAKKVLSNGFILLTFLSVIIMVIVFFAKKAMLMAFGASEELFPYADSYLTIYNLGTFFSIMSVGLNCFIIAQGFSKMGMFTILLGAVINIILDPIFIFVLKMDVEGAALATIIAQFVSFCFTIWFLTGKKTIIKLSVKYFNFKIARKIIINGLSPCCIIATDSIMIILFNSMLQKYGGNSGDILIASATIMFSFMQIITLPLGGITGGTQPILSYNYGACNFKRVKTSVFYILGLCLIFTTIMFFIAQFLSVYFVRIFTNDIELINRTVSYIKIFSMMIIPLSFQYTFVDGMTALGIAPIAISLSMTRKILVMMILILVLPKYAGIESIFYAEPIADLIGAILSTTVFLLSIGHIFSKRQKLVLNT